MKTEILNLTYASSLTDLCEIKLTFNLPCTYSISYNPIAKVVIAPVIFGYYSKSKAENTEGGIVYETAMKEQETTNSESGKG